MTARGLIPEFMDCILEHYLGHMAKDYGVIEANLV